jgi:sigma-E factor negative regulatory protein RseA
MKDAENGPVWQALSDLADGEADAALAGRVTAAWRDDAALRERWHAYQLIGDVLRSDELAGCGGDAAFLQRLRGRLAEEPVVLAPAAAAELPAVQQPAVARRRWARPAAVAAGFMMVAGALTVMRLDAPAPAAAPQLAVQQAPTPVAPALVGPQPVVAAAEAGPERVEVANGVLIRDARLDAYLAAHQQFGGGAALGLPAGFLRGAAHEGPAAVDAGSR